MKARAPLLTALLGVVVLLGGPVELVAQPKKADEERKVADQLFDAGKAEEAKAIYERLAPSFANDFAFNKRLAQCFFMSPKSEMAEASRYFARAHELNPKDSEVELNLAKSYAWSKQFAAAITVFQSILQRDPDNGEARLELARAQSSAGQPRAARDTYQSYLKSSPDDRDARIEFAAFLSWNKQTDAALQQYQLVLKADPSNKQARIGRAQVLAWQGKLDESLSAYGAVLADAPGEYAALRGKAFVLLWLRRYDEAGKAFSQVTRLKPPDPEIRDALQQIARWRAAEPERQTRAAREALAKQIDAALGRNDLPEAIRLLQEAVARDPKDAPSRFRLGDAYLWNRQWTEAIETFQSLRAEQPDNLDALRELGKAQVGAGQLAEAVASFRGYLERLPADADVRLSLARVLSWSGDLKEAAAMYEQVLQARPDSFDASLGLAQVLSWQGHHQRALERFEALLSSQPDQRDALLGQALALHASGQAEKALELLERMRQKWPDDREIASAADSIHEAERQRALQATPAGAAAELDRRIARAQETLARNPSDLETLRTLGDLYQQKSDFPTAASYYEKALSQRPSDTALRLRLAQVAAWGRDFPRSIGLYRELVAEEPDKQEYRTELARVLSWAGRNSESIEQYRELLRRRPDDVEARLGLARVLSWNKQLDEALAEYGSALAADPQNRQAQIERARVLSWKGDWVTALQAYDDILARSPEDHDALLGKAQTLAWSGRPREAKAILEQLQAAQPKDRDTSLAIAGVQSALGRRDLALRELDELDKLQPGNSDVELMRRNIRHELRPMLVLGLTHSEDSFDLEIYYSTATLSFSPTPQIRSYLSGVYIPSKDPSGDETGRELLFGSSGRIGDRLLLRGEIGVNSGTAGPDAVIGGAGATVFATEKMQFDFDYSRRFLNYIPQALRLGVSRDQMRLAWDWRPGPVAIHADYYYQRYSDTNENNGGNFSATVRLVRKKRFELETGYLYAAFGFAEDFNSGYWAPSQFQRHAGLVNLHAQPSAKVGFGFWGSLGKEQAVHDPFRLDGTARGALELGISKDVKLTLGYGYFSIASIASAGASETNTGYATFEWRF